VKKYLTEKLIDEESAPDKVGEYLDREVKFNRDVNTLKSAPVDKVDDFQKPLVKDIPREKINKLGDVLPQSSGSDFQKNIEAKRAALRAKTGKLPEIPNEINYNEFKKGISHAAPSMKGAGKKILGALPFLGAGYAALQGDPAMAAEELATDAAGPAGMAYEAIRPEIAGNPEEERQMLAERNAQGAYQQSPAHLARLQALQKIGK
jgi:hypothetical protein